MMEIRRRIIGLMANRAKVIKGTFTCPSSGSSYELVFPETINKYIYFVEMTDSSKPDLVANTDIDRTRTYAILGTSETPEINNVPNEYNSSMIRYKPSSGSLDGYTSNSSASCQSSKIVFMLTNVVTGSANSLYHGYSYNYIIISLDNI